MLIPDFMSHPIKKQDHSHEKLKEIRAISNLTQFRPVLSSKPRRKQLYYNQEIMNEQQKLPSLKINLNSIIVNEHQSQCQHHKVQKHPYVKISLYNLQLRSKQIISNQVQTCQLIVKKPSKKKENQQKKAKKQSQQHKRAVCYENSRIKVLPSLRTYLGTEHCKNLLPNLQLIYFSDLLVNNSLIKNITEEETFRAFYQPKKMFVKAIRYQKSHIYSKPLPGLLPIIGQLKIKLTRYVIVVDRTGKTLATIIQQFGPCSERFIKQALRQLVTTICFLKKSGENLHSLTPSSIYVNNYGNLMIDTVQCNKDYPITKQQSLKNMYYVYPETLCLQQLNSKSQVWALGNIILSMLLGVRIDNRVLAHPYNQGASSYDSKQIFYWHKVQKRIKQCLGGSHEHKKQYQKQYQSENTAMLQDRVQQTEISEQLSDIMEACFKLNYENRPSIQELSDLQYFQS